MLFRLGVASRACGLESAGTEIVGWDIGSCDRRIARLLEARLPGFV
jgi:hypothetical protein